MSRETLKTLERMDADIVELDGRINNRKVETRKARSDIDHLMARLDALEGKTQDASKGFINQKTL